MKRIKDPNKKLQLKRKRNVAGPMSTAVCRARRE